MSGIRTHNEQVVTGTECKVPITSVLGTTLYMMKFASNMRQVGGFLRVLRFPPPIKLTATIYLIVCWKWH